MEKVKGYEEAQAFTGEYETIKLGGHLCKIIGAKVEKSKSDNDMLVVAFDIAEGENKDFYKRRLEEDKVLSPDNAKWRGIHRLLLKDIKTGECNSYFKGFITSVEASNKEYKFDWDEKKLKDKLFGGIFGREEYINAKGESKFSTKLRFIRSVEKVKDVEAPVDKLLNIQNNTSNADFLTVEDDDECPF